MKKLLLISLMVLSGLLAAGAAWSEGGPAKSGDLTAVIDDHVPVYTRMATGGGVIHELSKGDRVAVQFEMEKSSIAWCSIIYKGESTFSGYVECSHLEQQKQKKWEQVQSTGRTPSSRYSSITHVRVVNNQVLVPVSLNYMGTEVPVEMLLDTGASATIIKTEVARRLGMDLAGAINVKAVVMGGGTIDVKVVQLTNISIGPHQVADPVIGVIDHSGVPVPFDGVLGMDFLGSVDYQIDLARRVITWR